MCVFDEFLIVLMKVRISPEKLSMTLQCIIPIPDASSPAHLKPNQTGLPLTRIGLVLQQYREVLNLVSGLKATEYLQRCEMTRAWLTNWSAP